MAHSTKSEALLKSIELALKGRPETYLPAQLKEAINACSTMDDLKELLLNISYKNEAAIKAFDQRINDLEGAA